MSAIIKLWQDDKISLARYLKKLPSDKDIEIHADHKSVWLIPDDIVMWITNTQTSVHWYDKPCVSHMSACELRKALGDLRNKECVAITI